MATGRKLMSGHSHGGALMRVFGKVPVVHKNANNSALAHWVDFRKLDKLACPDFAAPGMPQKDRDRIWNGRHNIMNHIIIMNRSWIHIRRIGLRIKHFESTRCYQSNGTPPVPRKQPYQIQNRSKIQLIPPAKVYTKLFRQLYVHC